MHAPVGRALQVVLIALALIAVVFGGWRLLAPATFYMVLDVDLPREPGLFSEVRGAGGIMLGAGLLVAAGAIVRVWTRFALLTALVLYSAIAIGRLVGLVLDGYPAQGAMTGLVIESVAALVAGIAYVRYSGERR